MAGADANRVNFNVNLLVSARESTGPAQATSSHQPYRFRGRFILDKR